MELCKQTLEDFLLEDNQKYSNGLPDEIFYYTRLKAAYQIVQGLFTIHTVNKLIHRDLSLRNIFLSKEGYLKIGDFGLSTKCRHLLRVAASPAPLQPMDSPDLSLLNGFSLDGGCLLEENKGEKKEFLDLLAEDAQEELTHGLGTKLFASPEQISDMDYDQKVIYREFNVIV